MGTKNNSMLLVSKRACVKSMSAYNLFLLFDVLLSGDLLFCCFPGYVCGRGVCVCAELDGF